MEFSFGFNSEDIKKLIIENKKHLNSIYKEYFQKSKVFLYPFLNIKKGVKFVPDNTYMSWDSMYKTEDYQFICVYKVIPKQIEKFREFELLILKSNRLFRHSIYIEGKSISTIIVTYDFSRYKSDIDRIIKGKYSQLSKGGKEIILDFFGDKGTIAEYIESFLFPEYWHEDYANLLNVNLNIIQDVYELCDKPNLEKECLKFNSTEIQLLKQNIISLQS